MLTDVLWFASSLTALLVTARLFTSGAEKLGLFLGLSPFTVGVLIVSTGTSLPELLASLIAVSRGSSQVVLGNVLGANLSNLLLVMGAVGVAARGGHLTMGSQYILIDKHYLLGAVFLLALSVRDGQVTWPEGLFLLTTYGLYVFYLLRAGKAEEAPGRGTAPPHFPAVPVALGLVAAVGLAFAAQSTITSLEVLALTLGIPPSTVALTLLSLGTTLPELVVSASAARAGQPDVAVGNVLGSCVFNTLGVAGAASLLGPVEAGPGLLALPLPAFAAAALLFYLLTLDKRVSRWEGLLFIALYGLFILQVAQVA